MNSKLILSYLILFLFIISCGTDSDPNPAEWDGSWKVMGLEDQEIHTLELSEDYIFAAGKKQVYSHRIAEESMNWNKLDLDINPELSVISGLLYTDNSLYVTLIPIVPTGEVPDGFNSLFRSADDGNSWNSIEIDAMEGKEEPFIISRLTKHNEILYAISGNVFRSPNGGSSWQGVNNHGYPTFISVNKEHPNQIWAGGTESFRKYLEVSKDYGETWTLLNEKIWQNAGSGGSVNSVSVYLDDSEVILAGMDGNIRKSVNGGEYWDSVLQGFIYSIIKNSKIMPESVYASGWNPGRDGIFILLSDDYGDTWDIEEFSFGDGGVPVNDMQVRVVNGKEHVYLATNQGVYAFRRE